MGTLQDRSTSGGFLCDFRDDDSESNLIECKLTFEYFWAL